MVTRTEAERYRDSYEEGLTVEEYVDFFEDCQRSAPEDKEFAAYTKEELEELAKLIIEINEEGKDDF